MTSRVLRLALVGLLALAACSESSSVTQQTSSTPTTAELGDGGGPGSLLGFEELEASDVDGAVWAITYRSESIQGREIDVTGMVARPPGPAPEGGFPVLSWAYGTTGLADECAPSELGPGALQDLQRYLDAGYVVAATDYEGMGGSGVHPYLVSDSEGRSVLDAARAARQLVPETSDALLVAGHSQGGHASLAAAEIAADWAPELDLVATVAVAPVADLTIAVPGMFAAPAAHGFAVLVAAGWASAYPDLDEADVLGPLGLDLARRAVEGDLCATEVLGSVPQDDPSQVVVAQANELARWRARIEENAIDPEALDVPVLIVQGTADMVISSTLTDRFVADLCEAGADVVHESYDGANHGTVIIEAGDDIVDWLEERLAGEPVAPTCG